MPVPPKLRWKVVGNDRIARQDPWIFVLTPIRLGVGAMGRALQLSVRRQEETHPRIMATYWYLPDGGYHSWQTDSVEGKLWNGYLPDPWVHPQTGAVNYDNRIELIMERAGPCTQDIEYSARALLQAHGYLNYEADTTSASRSD